MDLAVGMIIGAAFTALVNSVVSNLFMPLISVFTGGIDFSNLYIPLSEASKEAFVKLVLDICNSSRCRCCIALRYFHY